MLYISIKFCEIISNGIKVIVRTRFLVRKLQRGMIPQTMEVECQFLVSARCHFMIYISIKFCKIISNGIKVIEQTRFLVRKLQKGNNSAKNVSGVTVFNLFMSLKKGNNSAKNVSGVTVFNLFVSSGHALYFYQVL